MLARVPRTGNAYILSGKLYNRATKRHVVKYLDSRVQANAIARFINDACDTYDESSEVTKRFKTKYYTNVGFKTVINPNKHPVFGMYMEVFALYDIPICLLGMVRITGEKICRHQDRNQHLSALLLNTIGQ